MENFTTGSYIVVVVFVVAFIVWCFIKDTGGK